MQLSRSRQGAADLAVGVVHVQEQRLGDVEEALQRPHRQDGAPGLEHLLDLADHAVEIVCDRARATPVDELVDISSAPRAGAPRLRVAGLAAAGDSRFQLQLAPERLVPLGQGQQPAGEGRLIGALQIGAHPLQAVGRLAARRRGGVDGQGDRDGLQKPASANA